MGGEAEPARMRYSLAVRDEEIGFDGEFLEDGDEGRDLPEGEKAGARRETRRGSRGRETRWLETRKLNTAHAALAVPLLNPMSTPQTRVTSPSSSERFTAEARSPCTSLASEGLMFQGCSSATFMRALFLFGGHFFANR